MYPTPCEDIKGKLKCLNTDGKHNSGFAEPATYPTPCEEIAGRFKCLNRLGREDPGFATPGACTFRNSRCKHKL